MLFAFTRANVKAFEVVVGVADAVGVGVVALTPRTTSPGISFSPTTNVIAAFALAVISTL